jgi:FtsP/CotA-like multicopper oxidase with cupredoxin domain
VPYSSWLKISLGAALVLAMATLLAFVYVAGPGPSSHIQTLNFTIMADDNGFNGSVQHALPWPIITVHQGDNVTITVVNDGKVEAHGFAIDGYFPQGLIVGPGESDSVTFTANQEGNFTFYCNIFCTVHQYMIGQLVVEK